MIPGEELRMYETQANENNIPVFSFQMKNMYQAYIMKNFVSHVN